VPALPLLAEAVSAWLARPPLFLGYVGVSILAAFVVRGFSGFGSSMIAVSALTLVMAPAHVVPAMFALEIVASVGLLPSVWRDVDWRSLVWIVGGCVVATPVGLAVLARAPENLMRALVSSVVVVAALVLLKGFVVRASPGPVATFGAGCLSGLLNGSTGLAGPPAVIFYFASEGAAARGRGSLIAFFVATDVFALVLARAEGLLDAQAAVLGLYALPFVALGIWLGHRRFIATEPRRFRLVVLWILAGLGVAGLVLAVLRHSAAT
jgi:uncharacterized protein